MIKSIKGDSLQVLDEIVNDFVNNNHGSKVVNFTMGQSGSINKPIYIYTIEYPSEEDIEKERRWFKLHLEASLYPKYGFPKESDNW